MYDNYLSAPKEPQPVLYIIVRNVTIDLAVVKCVLEIETIIWKQR